MNFLSPLNSARLKTFSALFALAFSSPACRAQVQLVEGQALAWPGWLERSQLVDISQNNRSRKRRSQPKPCFSACDYSLITLPQGPFGSCLAQY
jgi:hypothetical protein